LATKQATLFRNRTFVLTVDMVPIHYREDEVTGHSVSFVCPLPVGYQRVVKECLDWLREETKKMILQVEKESWSFKGEFANLATFLVTPKTEKAKLESSYAFSHVNFDDRGFTGITAGHDVNSGDIYLSTDATYYYEWGFLDGFKKNLESHHAFHCHNVDFYWQAIKDRAVVVRYFNLLQTKLKELET